MTEEQKMISIEALKMSIKAMMESGKKKDEEHRKEIAQIKRDSVDIENLIWSPEWEDEGRDFIHLLLEETLKVLKRKENTAYDRMSWINSEPHDGWYDWLDYTQQAIKAVEAQLKDIRPRA
tara:strand:+ start:1479 stop:1841 length:363 start_codon:yes stop_codon:yes gene_type:complete